MLIAGETGTGKDVLARAIHAPAAQGAARSSWSTAARWSASLIESELFGHEKGAFTGALERRQGAFELAQGGTLFLDEIGELPLELQPQAAARARDRAHPPRRRQQPRSRSTCA